MKRWTALWVFAVMLAVGLLTFSIARPPRLELVPTVALNELSELRAAVQQVDAELARLWEDRQVQPADSADELTLLRRLSLALHGTIPSLEELRVFEADARPDRLDHWLAKMLEDQRFADYFSERLARGYVGVEGGQFIVYRRDRFKAWLSTELRNHTPYDQITRDLVSAQGVWTGQGEVNFLTSGFADGEFDPNKLTARTVRAFLGQRIDCAQCHDHPFDHWKQHEFEGLAAYYGKISLTGAGVMDDKKKVFHVDVTETEPGRAVEPNVPFHPEWLGQGEPREQLGNWVTHAENQRFERAIANRVWALMFGKPFLATSPVDDLPDPGTDPDLKTLDLLGADFRQHNCDLRRLIRVIVGTRAFRMSTIHPLTATVDVDALSEQEQNELREQLQSIEESWAVFPLIRLRPEQVIGSMLQATHIHTIDQNSHLVVRLLRFARENDFVNEFGDPGVDELQDRVGTIPQALLRLNGEFSRELTEPNGLLAPGRIAGAAATPEKAVEIAYLVCLTRRPTSPEMSHFAQPEAWQQDRGAAMQDLYWALYNSPEFNWNH